MCSWYFRCLHSEADTLVRPVVAQVVSICGAHGTRLGLRLRSFVTR